MRILLLFNIIVVTCASATSFAQRAGNHGFGALLNVVSTDQSDLDTLIDNANTQVGGISNPDMGSGYELSVLYNYRIERTMFAIQVRPSYFFQTSEGTGDGETYEYELSGFTLFPILRMIPLENNFIKFFMQFGLGMGVLSGSIQEGGAVADFSGSRLGMLGGIGAEFCFTANHCMNLEGNFRHLPIERNVASRASGTFGTGSLTQAEDGDEVEIDGRDLATTMSGIMGSVGYVFYF